MPRYAFSLLVLLGAILGLGRLATLDDRRPADGPTGTQSLATPAPAPFTLAIQTNRRSELEPCGCARNQQGGLDREARIYQQFDEDGALVLKLEAGGFTDNLMTENERLKTRFMLQALHATGTHCLNVGAGDFCYGLAALRDEASSLTLVSANVRAPGVAELPFDPFRVFEMAHAKTGETLRVGVIGLSGPPPGSISSRVDPATASLAGPDPARTKVTPATTIRPLQGPTMRVVEIDRGALDPSAAAAPDDAAATSPSFVIPEGTFDTRDLGKETDYGAPSTPAPLRPGAALLPRDPHYDALDAAIARWHAAPAKGDTGGDHAGHDHAATAPAANTTPAKGDQSLEDVLARVPTAPLAYPNAGTIADVTASDPTLAAILADARTALATLPSAAAHDRNAIRVELLDPRAALDLVVPALRPRVDVLVVLWFDAEQRVLAAAQGLEGIDAIVTMEVSNRYEKLRREGDQHVFRAGYDGRMMALLGIDRAADGALRRTLAMREVASDAETVPEIAAILLAYRLTQREAARQRAALPPVVQAGGSSDSSRIFVGAQSCQECHANEYDSWLSTPHATAIDTLIDAAAEYNPDCISCHVTGLPPATNITERGGFISMTRTPHMANVQCETCHGPGWQHVTNMRRALYYERTSRADTAQQIIDASKGLMVASPKPETCLECHVPKTGAFDFDERLPFVSHGQHYPADRAANRPNKAVDMMAAFLVDGREATP